MWGCGGGRGGGSRRGRRGGASGARSLDPNLDRGGGESDVGVGGRCVRSGVRVSGCEGIREWGGSAGWASGLAWLSAGPVGPLGGGSLFFCFVFYTFYLFYSSVLNHFKLFRHFIKMGLLHHNYLCNI